ncbi:MAG: DUF4124 domain-containing protein [bacterium]
MSSTPHSFAATIGLTLLVAAFSARSALAAPPVAPGAATPITLGSPAVDFSVGSAGVGSDAAVYFWIDQSGVTHFTDEPGEFGKRYRDFFRPIDLFVNTAGQPKR